MKIIIISDTHTDDIKELAPVLIEEITGADAVLHAGDVVGNNLIKELKKLNRNVYAVAGNMDKPTKLLPVKRELVFDGIKIGLAHGGGSPFGLENRLLYLFEEADIIVYGHTHKPFVGKIADIYFINPGSPNNNRYQAEGTYAVLEIVDGIYRAKIREI